MGSDLISIIIPVYNIRDYVETCVDSILKQTYEEIEIIIVNDGSTDGSETVCKKLCEKDKRIQYYEQSNGGPVGARLTGLGKATGKYVIFVDGDDYIEPELVSSMYEYITRFNVDFVHCNCLENGVNNGYIKENRTYCSLSKDEKIRIIKKNILGSGLDYSKDSFIEPSIHAKISTLNFARYCLNMVPTSQHFGEDVLYLIHMVMNCNSFALVSDAYYNYRVRCGSLSHKEDAIDSVLDELSLYRELSRVINQYDGLEVISGEVAKKYCYKGLETFGKAFLDYMTKSVEYVYPEENDIREKRVILYGAGKVGKSYYKQFLRDDRIHVVCWIDKENGYTVDDIGAVKDVDCVKESEYDMVIVAILNESVADEIRDELVRFGVDSNKIVWKKPITKYTFTID